MKAVGVIGYKKSGKTTLVIRLSQELSRMGYRVAILKHVSRDIDFPDTDTSKYRSYVPFVSAISSLETEIILKGEKRIEDILTYVDCDIVLIEGFKKEKTFPKIV
ncbi:MAG: molybdopterin-guanine dinucleotide biosynthesis protein B, partial [Desulfobacteraceae bacterium]